MNRIRKIATIFLILFTIKIEAYKILGIFPLAFKSHNIFFQALMKSLAKKGHQVDVISYYEHENPPENYRDIINLSKLSNSSHFISTTQFSSIQEAIEQSENILNVLKDAYGLPVCKIIAHEEIQNFIQALPQDSPYDAVITEGIAAPCYYGFGFILKVPVISASSSFEFLPLAKQMGNPACMSFLPAIMIPKFQVKTFWDRMRNTIETLILSCLFLLISENQSEIMRKYLSPDIPFIRDVERTVALSILNTHHTLRGVKPVTNSVIEIAGIHIEEDNSTLNAKLKKWMDESVHGIVYMSLGTVLPLETLPKETILSMFSSFAKLQPMRILMKVTERNKLPPEIPGNILTMEWIPQIPVLNHRNTRLFISHGGIHSIMEAVYFGVPIIALPLFFDQDQNVRPLVAKNICTILDHEEITENVTDAVLSKMLNDPQVRKAAKHHSKVFRDRPMRPGEEAVYWIEYVIKNGAESLQSPAIKMYWWELELLDVYAFLFLCATIIIYLIIIVVRKRIWLKSNCSINFQSSQKQVCKKQIF